jgi:hypothetical protein
MAKPFDIKPLYSQSTLQRMLGMQVKDNAYIEINNLLAAAEHIQEVTNEAIHTATAPYKVNLVKAFSRELQNLYRDYFSYCLEDGTLNDEENANLAHLQHILEISDKAAITVQSEAAQALYRLHAERAVADGRLTADEQTFLENIREAAQLSREIADQIYTSEAKGYLNEQFKRVTANQRLSLDDEMEMRASFENLGVDITNDPKIKAMAERYHLLWLVENGELQEVSEAITLQKSERPYFAVDARQCEYRRQASRSSGTRTDTLVEIDRGRLVLTNKRLLFMAKGKTTAIQLAKIVNVTQHNGGVEINKGSGKNPFFFFSGDVEVFTLMLRRFMREAN